MSVEELCRPVPDEASVLTYVATLYQAIKSRKKRTTEARSSSNYSDDSPNVSRSATLDNAGLLIRIRQLELLLEKAKKENKQAQEDINNETKAKQQAQTAANNLIAELERLESERNESCDKEADCQKKLRELERKVEDLEFELEEQQEKYIAPTPLYRDPQPKNAGHPQSKNAGNKT